MKAIKYIVKYRFATLCIVYLVITTILVFTIKRFIGDKSIGDQLELITIISASFALIFLQISLAGETRHRKIVVKTVVPIISLIIVLLAFVVYDILKNRVSEDLPFYVDSTFQNDLDKGLITEAMRQIFKSKGVPLSKEAAVSIEMMNSKWALKDSDDTQMYIIKKEDNSIGIYPKDCYSLNRLLCYPSIRYFIVVFIVALLILGFDIYEYRKKKPPKKWQLNEIGAILWYADVPLSAGLMIALVFLSWFVGTEQMAIGNDVKLFISGILALKIVYLLFRVKIKDKKQIV